MGEVKGESQSPHPEHSEEPRRIPWKDYLIRVTKMKRITEEEYYQDLARLLMEFAQQRAGETDHEQEQTEIPGRGFDQAG